MKVEELINSDSLIVVDGEYTDGAIRQAYTEGYNEAMRWRDVYKGLPDKDVPVLVKNANNKYRVSQLRITYNADNTRDIFFSGENDFTKTITHWRPIE